MIISYTYTVLSVDPSQKTMVVRYSAEGYQDIQAVLPLPDAGGSVSAVAEMYAPVFTWTQLDRPVLSVTPGATGSATAATVSITPGVPFRDFYLLFTSPERAALIAATQTDATVKRYYDELWMRKLISTALPEVDALLSQLVTLSAITGARKTAILAALPAPV